MQRKKKHIHMAQMTQDASFGPVSLIAALSFINYK